MFYPGYYIPQSYVNVIDREGHILPINNSNDTDQNYYISTVSQSVERPKRILSITNPNNLDKSKFASIKSDSGISVWSSESGCSSIQEHYIKYEPFKDNEEFFAEEAEVEFKELKNDPSPYGYFNLSNLCDSPSQSTFDLTSIIHKNVQKNQVQRGVKYVPTPHPLQKVFCHGNEECKPFCTRNCKPPFSPHLIQMYGMPPRFPEYEYTHSPGGPLPLAYDWTMFIFNRLRQYKPTFDIPDGENLQKYMPTVIPDHIEYEMDIEHFANTRFGTYRLKPDNPKRPPSTEIDPEKKKMIIQKKLIKETQNKENEVPSDTIVLPSQVLQDLLSDGQKRILVRLGYPSFESL